MRIIILSFLDSWIRIFTVKASFLYNDEYEYIFLMLIKIRSL